ncbi:MAG: phage tail sheath family protein [Fimbriimonas sp.]
MPEYLAPGVFVEEIDAGSKPIEGVGVSTAAFIGYAKSGEFNKPVFITSWSDFVRVFGEEDEAILGALSHEYGKSTVELLSAKRASRKTLIDFAGDFIRKSGPTGAKKVKTFSDLVREYKIPQDNSPYIEGTYLAYAVRGFFDNGGSKAYVVRVARQQDLDALSTKTTGASETKAASLAISGLTVKALESGTAGNAVKVEIKHDGDGFSFTATHGDKSDTFKTEKADAASIKKAVADQLKGSTVVQVQVSNDAARPDAGVFNLAGGATAGANALALPLSSELAKVQANEFIGDESKRSGLLGLSVVDDINFIAIPDLMAGVWKREQLDGADLGPEVLVLDEKRVEEIIGAQALLISYCERMGDRMAILDPIPGLNPQEVRDTVLNAPFTCERGQAAIYYPWIKVIDQVNRPGGKRFQTYCPPSGHIAGVWARTAVQRGVHKAPANEGLMGAVALEYDITKSEQEILNPNGINAIRAFPGVGIKVWGARTLATVGNPSWKYVNVRNLFNFLERSMERGLQWVVFEPNDEDLWGRVRRTLSSFLLVQWREGMLFGSVPEEAFYVKCDRETNPQEMIDQGRLYVEIGVNPVKPAEFVIVRIGQWAGGGAVSEG